MCKKEQFRSFWEEEENRKLGEQLRRARKKRHVTQTSLAFKFDEIIERALREKNFSQSEIENYFLNKLTEAEKRKFRKLGVWENYQRITIQTISRYENGHFKIPACYVELVKEVLEIEKI